MVNPAAFRRLSVLGTPAQKAGVGNLYTDLQDEENQRQGRQLDVRDKTAELALRRTFEPPAQQAARQGQTMFGPGGNGGGGGQPQKQTGGGMPAFGFEPRVQSGIGGKMPQAWSGPQGNFEAAKRNGEMTPEKIGRAHV